MKTKRFIHNNLRREYHVFGSGSEILYSFHGFGQAAIEWKTFEIWLEKRFTVFAFADFLHEQDDFPSERISDHSLGKNEIAAYFLAFAKAEGHHNISLMAYSSGGRTALTLLELNPFEIDELWLFAPDGIKISIWNKLFCRYTFVQNIYKKIIQDPGVFFSLTRFLKRIGIVNSSLAGFVLYSMRNKEKRQKIYDYWMIYRNIIPDIERIISILNNSKVSLHLIFGNDDKIISAKIGREFKRRANKNVDLLELDSGHQLIDVKHLEMLLKHYA